MEPQFQNLFKTEIKSAGRKLLSQEKISVTSHSDTEIQAYTRTTPAFKIQLSSKDISSTALTAQCTCPVAQKNRFCKHVWATLLCVTEKYPDFLGEKTDLTLEVSISRESAHQETAKKRASDYRKAQYQKQKEKKSGKATPNRTTYTAEVEAALAYFSVNGFPMPDGPSKEILSEAKKKLSRFFHPDRGGTHEESVELNQNYEVLTKALSNHEGRA